MSQASQDISQQFINGGVLPAHLESQQAVSKKYVDGQNDLQNINISAAVSSATTAQATANNHINSPLAHLAQHITYSGEASGANVKQALDGMDTRIDNLILESGDSSPEVEDARGGYTLLGDRLNTSDAKLAEKVTQTDFDLLKNQVCLLTISPLIDKMSGQAVKIVCYGDSVTYGDAGSGRSATPYPETLQSRLRLIYNNNNIIVVNSGANGQKSTVGLANFDTTVVPQKPDAVIIMYGINDASGYAGAITILDEFENAINGMIDKCISNKFIPILLSPTFTMMTNQSDGRIANYGNKVLDIAKRRNVAHVDMNTAQQQWFTNGSISPGNLMLDGAHMTDAGYQLIADTILFEILDKNGPNALVINNRDRVVVPAVNTKFVKHNCTFTGSNGAQFSKYNFLFYKDGSTGSSLTFDFFVNTSGMDLYIVSPKVTIGGKLRVIHNGVTLGNSINFYSEDSALYDTKSLVLEDLALGYHRIELNVSNLTAGDSNPTSSDPVFYVSAFEFSKTEKDNTLITGVGVTLENFIPVIAGSIKYNSANAFSNAYLFQGKHAQIKTGKKLVIELEGVLFSKCGLTWFSNKAGNSNIHGRNSGYLLLFADTTVSLYHSATNDVVETFTSSIATITLDYAVSHHVRIEQTENGSIKVFIDGTLKIDCVSKRFNSGYFGFYNQAVAGKTMRLAKFEYCYV
jgi:lysophospholipase L1-like esterase